MFKLIFEPRPHRLNALQSNLRGIFVSRKSNNLFEKMVDVLGGEAAVGVLEILRELLGGETYAPGDLGH